MVTTRYSDQQGSKSRQKVMRLYKQWHRPISKRFIKPPYSIREQPRSTRNVVAYPRPAFSAKNRKNYAPTSFDQQVQVSQGHTFCTEIRKIVSLQNRGILHGCWCDELRLLQEWLMVMELELKSIIRASEVAVLKDVSNNPKKSHKYKMGFQGKN